MLNDNEKIQYLQRSYSAVDGLWFMKMEDRYGFENALDIDASVWEIMPKIQARFLKEKLNEKRGLDSLLKCFSIKLELDGFKFKSEKTGDDSLTSVKFTITKCPWNELLIKSNRSHLAGMIGDKICRVEYAIWAKEFGKDIVFNLEEKGCGISGEAGYGNPIAGCENPGVCTFSFKKA